MRGINHHEQSGWAFSAGYTTECYINGDAFVSRSAIQTVNAGQIDQVEGTMSEFHGTLVFLNRHTRKVSGRLTKTCQTVEEGAFTCIGVTDERYGSSCLVSDANTTYRYLDLSFFCHSISFNVMIEGSVAWCMDIKLKG